MLFQGGQFDAATGQYKFQARDYDPKTGIWKEQDPKGYVQGLDLDKFVQNNPAHFVDPSGLAGIGGDPNATDPNYAGAVKEALTEAEGYFNTHDPFSYFGHSTGYGQGTVYSPFNDPNGQGPTDGIAFMNKRAAQISGRTDPSNWTITFKPVSGWLFGNRTGFRLLGVTVNKDSANNMPIGGINISGMGASFEGWTYTPIIEDLEDYEYTIHSTYPKAPCDDKEEKWAVEYGPPEQEDPVLFTYGIIGGPKTSQPRIGNKQGTLSQPTPDPQTPEPEPPPMSPPPPPPEAAD